MEALLKEVLQDILMTSAHTVGGVIQMAIIAIPAMMTSEENVQVNKKRSFPSEKERFS